MCFRQRIIPPKRSWLVFIADGGDPEGIGQRGVAFVKQLLDKRRLAWQEAARQKLEPDELRPNVPPRMM